MPVLHSTELIRAPLADVFDAARDVSSFVVPGSRIVPPGVMRGLLDEGDTVCVRNEHRGRLAAPVLRLRITALQRPDHLELLQQRGPRSTLRYRQTFAATGAGTLMTDELWWSSAIWAPFDALVSITPQRRRMLAWLSDRAERVRSGVVRQPPVIVAAAIIDAGKVLAARRREPAWVVGRWELPGGKVDSGEPATEALLRECREELGVTVEIGDRVGADVPIGADDGRLRVWQARLADGTPEPREHEELRWLSAADLDSVEWLPADRALLPHLRRALRR